MGYLLDLAEAGSATVSEVGGKAHNLGLMMAAGLPVPPGFCVSTAAYRAAVGAALDVIDHQPAELRRRVEAVAFPAGLAEEVTAAYRRLGADPPVAVRSSATAEDLADASFAGQQDSYLNVVGATAVLDAVRRCWASLWTDRAVAYRDTHGIDQGEVALAVVVQQMVPAEVAGVMFTANPVTGTRHETVIDASPGLGEAVVSGAVNPDHVVVDRRRREISLRRVGSKEVVIRSRAGGGTERVATPATDRLCLSDEQILALSDLGQRAADLYAAPQDTEWALDPAGRFWLTQARAVTTLYPVPDPAPVEPRLLFCMTLAQGLTRPITPMGLAAFRLLGSGVARAAGRSVNDPPAGPNGLHTLGGRVFIDITVAARHRIGRRLVIAALSVMEARSAAALRRLVDQPDFTEQSGSLSAFGPIVRVMVRTRAPLRMLAAAISPRLAYRGVARFELQLRTRLSAADPNEAEARLDLVERELSEQTFTVMPSMFAYAAAGFAQLGLARRLLRGMATREEVQQVQRSLPHNVTTEMDLALWSLTEQVRADPAAATALAGAEPVALAAQFAAGTLPAVAQRGLAAFLDRYGHRAVAEIDVGMPRWRDDPTHLLGVVANYLRLADPALAPAAQFTRGVGVAETMTAELTRRAAQRSRLRGRLVRHLLTGARQLMGLRETPKFNLVFVLAAMRRQLVEVGRALAADGRLERAEDVFFLDLVEARSGLHGRDLRPVVAERHAQYDRELQRRHVPRLLLSDGTELEALAPPDARSDGALTGSPASAGIATGTARVVLDPVGAHLEPGEILVAPSTDPGWTPLFLTAGGLVMEMGGANSHGAVVAREYGIPAVVGVPLATRLITSGERVTVDGAAGLVTPSTVPAG